MMLSVGNLAVFRPLTITFMDETQFEALLSAANMSKQDFADAAGVTIAAVHKWRREGKYPQWTLGWLEGRINTAKLEDIRRTWQTLNSEIATKNN